MFLIVLVNDNNPGTNFNHFKLFSLLGEAIFRAKYFGFCQAEALNDKTS